MKNFEMNQKDYCLTQLSDYLNLLLSYKLWKTDNKGKGLFVVHQNGNCVQ